jgi:hypothetical protein
MDGHAAAQHAAIHGGSGKRAIGWRIDSFVSYTTALWTRARTLQLPFSVQQFQVQPIISP